MATSIKLPEDLTRRAEKRRGFLAEAYAARAEFRRSGTGYALAEVIVSKNADADLERLVTFLESKEPAEALATYVHAAARATWPCTNTTCEPTRS